MPNAIVIARHGGPSVLRWRALKPGDPGMGKDGPEPPGPGEVRIKHTAIGLNFIDTYHRTGLYKVPLPFIPGVEAAGIVTALGKGVTGLRPGARVAYFDPPPGAYAEERNYRADHLVKLPPTMADETAAALLLKGMTAQVLLRQVHKVKAGETVLIHAAAGGVGSILTQWAKHLGATVIGTVGSAAKARRARAQGCDHVIDYSRSDFAEKVLSITKGEGVPVVYDSVGKATQAGSLKSLSKRGLLVAFGQSSGPPPAIAPLDLSPKSLFVTRAGVYNYVDSRAKLDAAAREMFRTYAKGGFAITIGQRYALQDAAQAHRDLEARKTKGSTLLLP